MAAPEEGGEESRSATTLGTSKRGHRHPEGAVPAPQPRHQTRQEQRQARRGRERKHTVTLNLRGIVLG